MMIINRRNFEDAPHGSAIFEDIKTIATQKSRRKKSDCLERERNFGVFYEQAKPGILRMSSTGAQFCSNRAGTSTVRDPSAETTLKAKSPIF